jgi:hypothetical protein
VTRLRALRASGHPLLLIGIWSLLEAGIIAWTALLPGSPFYADSGNGSLGQAVFITSIVAIFLFLGSRLAWWFAIFFDAGGVFLGVVAIALEPALKPVGWFVLSAAAWWLIWSGSVERYVNSGRRARRPIAPPVAR